MGEGGWLMLGSQMSMIQYPHNGYSKCPASESSASLPLRFSCIHSLVQPTDTMMLSIWQMLLLAKDMPFIRCFVKRNFKTSFTICGNLHCQCLNKRALMLLVLQFEYPRGQSDHLNP